MTRQEFDFFEENKLEEKGYKSCSFRYYDDKIQIFSMTEDDHAVVDVKTGNVEFRSLTQDEEEKVNKVIDGELEAVIEYSIEKKYAKADEGFCHLIDLENGKMIWYVAKLDRKTGKAKAEEFLVTHHTPSIDLHAATEEELRELDEYLLYVDDLAHECAAEDDRIDHIELASTFRMKYKLYPDIYEKSKEGEDVKVCYMMGEDDVMYTVGGLEVGDMEHDLTDPMMCACRDAVLKRLEAYRAKQKE